MARSLTVRHEEIPATNPLLTGFLLIAALVLIASALEGMLTESKVETSTVVFDAR